MIFKQELPWLHPLTKIAPPIALQIPQWTLAFNAVALTAFASTRPLEGAVAEAALQMSHVITSPLRGISEIFLVDSAFAGEGKVKSI